MVRIEGLHKTYNVGRNNAFHALRGVDVNINDGEMVAITGKSGAGKSTLLHILGGIDTFEEGSYHIGDYAVGKLSDKQLAVFRNEQVGIVLQDFALVEDYTAKENVMIPLFFAKKKKRERENLSMLALKEVGMDELADKEVNKLSGGQKQRVAIARAIVNNPSFILADEPTGSLDTQNTEIIMKLFRSLNEKGKTVVIVTHDMQIAEACDRTIEISDGKVIHQ